ncbi:MAG: hypothetical protein U1F42_08920 [Candidatus Competibacteraceae bacterium]
MDDETGRGGMAICLLENQFADNLTMRESESSVDRERRQRA